MIPGGSAAKIKKQDAPANARIAITHGELLRKTGGVPLKGGKCDFAVSEYNDSRLNLRGPYPPAMISQTQTQLRHVCLVAHGP